MKAELRHVFDLQSRSELQCVRTSIDAMGDNRAISCCHRFCHLACHRAAAANHLKGKQKPCGSAVAGDGRETGGGDPLFDGKCRPGALRVPRGFALLQGRHRPFLSRVFVSLYYTRRYIAN
jgi:hypothetical protein